MCLWIALQLKNARGSTPLALAVQYGNYGLCKLFLENGAIVDRTTNAGQWNLMDAVAYYNVFAEGQDIPGLFAAKGRKPTTIHQAAGIGDLEVVQRMLASGTPAQKCKEGQRAESCDHPIHWAARSGHAQVVKALIDAGVRVCIYAARSARSAQYLHNAWTVVGGPVRTGPR